MSRSIFDVMLVSSGGKLRPASDFTSRNHNRSESAYEHGLREVERTGNKWAIENYKATHNKNDGT